MKDEMTREQYLSTPPADLVLFRNLTQGLPTSKIASLGPHSIKSIRRAAEVINPRLILEIGFNVGYSASMWLSLAGSSSVVSVDISESDETWHAAQIVRKRYPGRFMFIPCASEQVFMYLKGCPLFDLVFIDGNHDRPGVASDIELARSLKIPRLCFDDYWPDYGAGVKVAIEAAGLNIDFGFGNIVLASWK